MRTTGVFDAHARLSQAADGLDRLLASMDACGIEQAAVSAGGVLSLDELATQVIEGGGSDRDPDNDAVRAAAERADGRLVPFYFANPHRGADVYRHAASAFRGLEISPAVHGVALDDPRTTALVEVAAEHRHPVYVVCLGRSGYDAVELAALAAAFPEVAFILGHCGFVGVDVWSLARVADRPNVLAETSGCYTAVARAALQRLGADRVLFGSEYPLQAPTVELAKIEALGLDHDTERMLTGANARRVFEEAGP